MINSKVVKEKIEVSNKVFWLNWSDGSATVYCFIFGQVKPTQLELSNSVVEDFNSRYTMDFKRYALNSWQE